MRYAAPDVDLAQLLKALGHPARLAMVEALAADGGCCCADIVRRLPLAQSTVSEHLKILRDAGLIEGTVEGPRAAYALAPARLADAVERLAAVARRAAAGRPCCGGAADADGIARLEEQRDGA